MTCEHCKQAETIWTYGGYAKSCKGCQVRHASILIRQQRTKAIDQIAQAYSLHPDMVVKMVVDEYKRRKALKDKCPSLF